MSYENKNGILQRISWLLNRAKRFFFKYVLEWFSYWGNSLFKKEKDLWAFSGFRGISYSDNSMYLYNYILEHHPEINAVWLTVSDSVIKRLKNEKKPVLSFDSREGRRILARAEIAVTDHFVMSDYKFVTSDHDPVYGFNAKTKVVQLWHGIGIKSMGDEKEVKNTTERGVRYSRDILVREGDNRLCRLKKRVKYIFVAPFRELFEKYFLFICPGYERRNIMAEMWQVPREARFMAGNPRDLPVYKEARQQSPIKIIYAPTYRFDYNKETEMIDNFLDAVPQIDEMMKEADGEFYLRLHPHTWRNYDSKILKVLDNYDSIFLDSEPDVYQSLGTYSIMISDYSSLAVEFAMFDRPTVFLGSDYEWYAINEAGFDIDYPNMIPGPMTSDWDETLQKVREYIDHPEKDSKMRKEKCEYFFASAVNGPDSSERIVQEIEKRIGLN